MSSAPPRAGESPAPCRSPCSPSARARGSEHCLRAARRAGRPARTPSGHRRGSTSRARHRPARSSRHRRTSARLGGRDQEVSASRSDPVRAAIDARSSISRTPSAAGRIGRRHPASARRAARAHVRRCPPSTRRRRPAAAARSARRRPESVARTARTPPTATEYAARPTACSPASASRSATSASGCQIGLGQMPGAAIRRPRPGWRRRRHDAPRAARCADAPEYTAERRSGCRNSTRPPRTVISPRSSASSEATVVESERGARVGDEPEVGAAHGRDEQDGPALGIHSRQPPAERVDDRPRHPERQSGLEALDARRGRRRPVRAAPADCPRSPGGARRTLLVGRRVVGVRREQQSRADSRSRPPTAQRRQPATTTASPSGLRTPKQHDDRVGSESARGEDEGVRPRAHRPGAGRRRRRRPARPRRTGRCRLSTAAPIVNRSRRIERGGRTGQRQRRRRAPRPASAESRPARRAPAAAAAAASPNGISRSDSRPVARSTRIPSSPATASSSRAVLPTPASPVSASTPLVPRRAAATSRSIACCSACRPTSMPRV